ncbi:MAG: Gfo/Idh/MocA family oxidoreductase [Epulopiscium sp.]|nr:Gfo/Idh/MocA family oxidoreductase [Candidatus Epulonipiscium sp.]
MKFAVIGAAHAHIYEFIDDMLAMDGEFIGIYEDHSEYVKEVAEKYNVPIFLDMKELFGQGVEVVGTSAINHEKIDVIEQCSNYNVHVIADKPIAVNEKDYKRLEKIIAKGNIEVGLMLTVRFMSPIYTIKQVIERGEIGQLLGVEIFSPHRLRAEGRPDWHFEKEKNGGIVIDLMIHSIDLYHWLTKSEISDFMGSVTKSILQEKEDFYDCAQFFVQSQNGANGYLRVDWHMTDTHWNWGDLRVFCTGSKGMIEVRAIGDPLTKELVAILFKEGEETRKLELEEANQSVTCDFIKRIRKEEHSITHQDILDATRLAIEFDKKAKKVNLI